MLTELLRRLRRLVEWTTYVYYRLDLLEVAHQAKDSPRVEVGHYAALLAPPEDSASPRHGEGFAQRAAARRRPGTDLYTITREGELAHWGWRAAFEQRHRLESVDDVLEVDAPSVLLVDFYTERAHRRQGLYEENIRKMLYDAAAEGARYAFIATRMGNLPSRRVIERVGFVPFRVYTRFRVWRWKWSRASPPDNVERVA